MVENNSQMTFCASKNVCVYQTSGKYYQHYMSGENSRKEEIILPASGIDASDLSHSAVNFSEAGVSGTQQGSGEHEDVIGHVSSLVRKQVATPSRGWFSRKTCLFCSSSSPTTKPVEIRNLLFFPAACLCVYRKWRRRWS